MAMRTKPLNLSKVQADANEWMRAHLRREENALPGLNQLDKTDGPALVSKVAGLLVQAYGAGYLARHEEG